MVIIVVIIYNCKMVTVYEIFSPDQQNREGNLLPILKMIKRLR